MRPLFRDKPEVPVYAETNVIQAVMRRLPYAFVDHRYPGVPHIVMHEVSVGTPLVLKDGSRVEPIRVMHGKLPIVGYLFDKLAYVTDCKTLPEETMERLKGIPTLVINALRLYEHPAHITLQEALHFIEEIKRQRAYLTHFAHTFGTHQEIEKMCPEGVFPAYDRLELTF